ncbi:MAG: MFS transporter [Bacillota bacterium]
MLENIFKHSKVHFWNRENNNLILFLSGKSISLFGSSIYAFVIGLYLLKSTGSGFTFAVNLVLYTLPAVIINPFAGVLADRLNKKLLIAGSDFLNGIFLALVYFYAANSSLSVNVLYISTFVMTSLTVFFDIAAESAKPDLVKEENLVKINSLARVIESVSFIAGPMLGGMIYAIFDIEFFILFNAFSFIGAAVIEYFIDYKFNRSEADIKNDLDSIQIDKEYNFFADFFLKFKEGYKYIFSDRYLKSLVFIFISLNFFFNFTIIVPLPYLLNKIWNINSSFYGIIQGAFPVGMILGAFMTDRILNMISYSKLLKKIIFLTGGGVILFVLPLIFYSEVPEEFYILIYYSILMFLCGISVAWIDIPANVLIQKIVPKKILGRVISVKFSLIKIIVPLSLLISGYLINFISPIFLVGLGAVIFTIFNFVFFSSDSGKYFLLKDINSGENRNKYSCSV